MRRNDKGRFAPYDNPLEHRMEIRIDDKTKSMLFDCMKRLDMTRSDVVRKGIEMVYDNM